MDGKRLTPRQKDILAFIEVFIKERGYPPTLREICARFKIKGPKNAAKHLDALERKGFLRRKANISRGMEVASARPLGAVSIPIAGRVRAGSPHLAVEDIVGRVTLDESFFNCRDAFLLKVEGESMTRAGIGEGDYLIVRPGTDVRGGDIVVAMIDGEATVKRFFRDGDAIVLKPENPDFKELRITPELGGSFSVVGTVAFVIKKIF
ncbi:MAG: transcriptional repressor LexA [Thermodesulfobacteriota bacterium]